MLLSPGCARSAVLAPRSCLIEKRVTGLALCCMYTCRTGCACTGHALLAPATRLRHPCRHPNKHQKVALARVISASRGTQSAACISSAAPASLEFRCVTAACGNHGCRQASAVLYSAGTTASVCISSSSCSDINLTPFDARLKMRTSLAAQRITTPCLLATTTSSSSLCTMCAMARLSPVCNIRQQGATGRQRSGSIAEAGQSQ